MQWLIIPLVLGPLLVAAASVVIPTRIAQALTIVAGAGALAIALVLAYSVRDGRTLTTLGGWLGLDALGAIFLLPTAFLYCIAGVYSVGYMQGESTEDYEPFARRYVAYLNLFCWTMLLVPLATDYASLWIAVELTTIHRLA